MDKDSSILAACLKIQRQLSLKTVLVASILLRGFLLVYGEWQDSNFAVKFTDIDYHVFSDAAQYVVDGKSPFLRPTYRYTPLLAIILTLNHYFFHSFGKVLFICCDFCAALLIHHILCLRGVGKSKRIFSAFLWLLNPLTATVSSRGNAESILAVLVLLTIYLAVRRQLYLSAISFGLAVHVKIFPVIYSLPLFLFIDKDYVTNTDLGASSPDAKNTLVQFFSPLRLKFVFVSIATFLAVTLSLYLLYGDEFIHEAYLYHVTRRDTRHNFSVYFYMLYLIQGSWLSLPVGILAFIPQVVLLLATSVWLYKDITLCCFVQTFIFVTFNKVCTSQYFLWYLCLLPLVTPFSRLSLSEGLGITSLWFLTQMLWLFSAYLLEFRGYNTFLPIWLAGMAFFLTNVYILTKFLRYQTITSIFQQGRVLPAEKHVSKLK